ncbi:MAG: hypothetical protein FWC06_03935 [Treponema sp.]|nr:hypothetical protein [Treponema sp.]
MQTFKWGMTASIFALLVSVLLGIFSGVSIFYVALRGFIFAAVFFGIGFGLRFTLDRFFPEIFSSDEETAAQHNEQLGSHINITLDSTGEYAVPELYKIPEGSDGMGNINDLISGVYKTRGSKADQKVNTMPSDLWFDNSNGEAGVMSEAIDRMNKSSYNAAEGGRGDLFQETSVFESFSSNNGVPSAEARSFEDTQSSHGIGGDSGLGGLPDLDMMARAFSSAPEATPASQASSAVSASPDLEIPSMSSAPSMAPYFTDDNAGIGQDRNTGNKPLPFEGDYQPKDIARGISTLLNKN